MPFPLRHLLLLRELSPVSRRVAFSRIEIFRVKKMERKTSVDGSSLINFGNIGYLCDRILHRCCGAEIVYTACILR